MQKSEIELNENTKALVDTNGVVVETVSLEEDKVDIDELVRQAKSGKFLEFTFPMVASGIDPDNPEESLIKMIYPTITFNTPASPRNVKKHIIKVIKQKFNKQITKKMADDMFVLGIEHMYRVRLAAQDIIDTKDENELMEIVAKSQQRAEKELDENPDVERV